MYDKTIFARNLQRLMTAHSDNQVDIARLLGVSKSTVSGYCKGTQMPRMDKVELLAAHFGVMKSDLIEDKIHANLPNNILPMPKMKKVPLLGTIACGEPILAAENIEDMVSMPENVDADFALRCKGESMINARIFDEDVVYIKQCPTVPNGTIAAVLIGDEATLKRVRLFEDHIILMPENPTYEPYVYWGEEMNNVKILGKAVAFTSNVR